MSARPQTESDDCEARQTSRQRIVHTGVALASNLGGMTSPISSPQNIFAIERMSASAGGAPSWLAWFAIALPVASIAAVLIWGLLLLAYPPNVKAVHQLPELKVCRRLNWEAQIFLKGGSPVMQGSQQIWSPMACNLATL